MAADLGPAGGKGPDQRRQVRGLDALGVLLAAAALAVEAALVADLASLAVGGVDDAAAIASFVRLVPLSLRPVVRV